MIATAGRPIVLWSGPNDDTDTGRFTRRIRDRLAADPMFHFRAAPAPEAVGPGAPDESLPALHVRAHALLDPHPPRSGRWIVLLPWPFGTLPRRWLEPLRFGVDDIWVHTHSQKRILEAAGVPEERIFVVPFGLELETPPRSEPGSSPLATTKTRRLLFIGRLNRDSGLDRLLEAYAGAFSRVHDVCLVIQDPGPDPADPRLVQWIHELEARRDAPSIEYRAGPTTNAGLRELCAACDALVLPCRAERTGEVAGIGLAAGIPVLVPDAGDGAEFGAEEHVIPVAARRVDNGATRIGGLETDGPVSWVEVDGRSLRQRLREVYEDPMAWNDRVDRGRAYARDNLSWDAVARRVAARLKEFPLGTVPLRLDAEAQHALRCASGVDCWSRGDRLPALRHFATALRYARSADALFNIGAALAEMGDTRGAIAHLEECRATSAGVPAADAAGRADPDVLELLAACRSRRDGGEAAAAARPPRIHWIGAAFSPTGFAADTRTFLHGLIRRGIREIRLEPLDSPGPSGTGADDPRAVIAALPRPDAAFDAELEVQQVTVTLARPPSAPRSILRTTFESDRLDDAWVDTFNRFSQVWVTSSFNAEVFARCGVVPSKLVVVPNAIDTAVFDPCRYRRTDMPGADGFRFLSVFDFTPRKGWDILLHSYVREFAPDEDVCLVLKVTNTDRSADPMARIRAFLDEHDYRRTPPIKLVHAHLADHAMAQLYANCDAFVLPSRGEGFGRPYLEALVMGLPAIATRWSGHLDFLDDDNGFLIDVEDTEPCERAWSDSPLYAGHRWAAPGIDATRRLMRRVFEDPSAAAERARACRPDLLRRFSTDAVGRQVADSIRKLLSA